jgi:hypothetical protein
MYCRDLDFVSVCLYVCKDVVIPGKYSNLRPSTNRKHFPAFVYVWNGAFTVGNWNRSCDVSHLKALSYFWRNCHVLMCLCARFNISKPMIIRYSHKKYEYKQVWSLLQYCELGNIEKYTKAHQNMKNNWISLFTITRCMGGETFLFPTVNAPFQT